MGILNRLFWVWRISDFPNTTNQGIVNGFCQLWVNNLWPYETSKNIFERINSLMYAASKATRSNGSLEESFPYESSYCVTSQISFDFW